MKVPSILFGADADLGDQPMAVPDIFRDLALDQVVGWLIAGRHDYDLAPFFYRPLHSLQTVLYRQDVFRDLGRKAPRAAVDEFATRMRAMRHLRTAAATSYVLRQKQRWTLSAAESYVAAATGLAREFESIAPKSRGLLEFRDALSAMVGAERFKALCETVKALVSDLDAIRYDLLIDGSTIMVCHHAPRPDYGQEIEEVFSRFRQVDLVPPKAETESGFINHIEAQVLDGVAHLNSEVFARLEAFSSSLDSVPDPLVVRFDREVQFYLAVLDGTTSLMNEDLGFCMPDVREQDRGEFVDSGFDLALAVKLSRTSQRVMTNGYRLEGNERIIVISGPNQGGKTTFARMVGQIHYLASLGCPVPGRRARLLLPDRIFTHFERQEAPESLDGKLQDDLVRMRDILRHATSRSLFIANEIFSSTSFHDALALGRRVLGHLRRIDAIAVIVTFLDELSRFDDGTVSMVSTVDPNDETRRTLLIVRRPADGLAHALALAAKHRLTSAALKERLQC